MQITDIDGGGEWDPLQDWPLIGIHAILTQDHELLTFGTDERGMQSAETIYDVWDYKTGTHYTLENTTGTDIFCSVQAFIPETGEILIIGGDARPLGNKNRGVDDVNVYNPEDRSLRPAEDGDLANARWYATAVTMSNGDIVVLGGINGAGAAVRVPEVYSAETGWRELPGIASDVIASGNNWWYPRAWPTSDGRIIVLDDRENKLYLMDTHGSGSIEYYADLPFNHTFEHPAIMVGEDLFLFASADDRAYLVDVSGSTPTIEDAGFTGDRVWGEMTILATGDVLITGGSAAPNSTEGENRTAMIWDRETNTIRSTDEAEDHARLYHSTAILLPDGSVLSLGGGAPGPYTHTNGQRYAPEYLYDDSGDLADRIEILDAPRDVEQQQDFSITVDDPASVARVTMVKHGSVTHSLNMETRFHEPEFTVNDDGTIVIDPTDNANVLTPGLWMVFVLDENDVPSEAVSINFATLENDGGPHFQSGIFEDVHLSGSARVLSDSEIELTSNADNQFGTATSQDRIDFRHAFEMSFEMFVGSSEDGADGLAVVFHNDPRGENAVGASGGGFGATGLQNGIAIEFDTYSNSGEMADDHTNVFITETGAALNEASSLGQLEDSSFHRVIIRWDPETDTLSYSVDGIMQPSLTIDPTTLAFDGDFAHLTISAATGGKHNPHLIRNITFNGVTETGDIGAPPEPGNTIPVREWPNGFQMLEAARLLDDGSAFQLTPDANYQFGAIAANDRLSFESNFMITLSIYAGTNEGGADGIAIAFHNDPRGLDAAGGRGDGLGVTGIQNGIAIEFDTYANTGEMADDHTHLFRTDDAAEITEATSAGQLEDGGFHAVTIRWNADSQTLIYTLDGEEVGRLTGDLVEDYLGGESGAYFVVSATTGGASNEQLVRNIRLMNGEFDEDGNSLPSDPQPEPAPTTDLTPWLALDGDALRLNDTIQLTADEGYQAGWATTSQRIDLSRDFDLKAQVRLGSKDGDGADGMAFVFHDDPILEAAAPVGGRLGVVGIENGFGLEIDTYQNPGEIAEDHFTFIDSASGDAIGDTVGLGNIEDGLDHELHLFWDASEQTLSAWIDGRQVGVVLDGDATAPYLSGGSAFLTIGAGTGGLSNEQTVQDIVLEGWLVT